MKAIEGLITVNSFRNVKTKHYRGCYTSVNKFWDQITGKKGWQDGCTIPTRKNMTLPLTSTQSIPSSAEEHSTCPSVHRARFESHRRSLGDRSMCFSSIDGKAPWSPVIKTDCQMAIKVMDSLRATGMKWQYDRTNSPHKHARICKCAPDTSSARDEWSKSDASSFCIVAPDL